MQRRTFLTRLAASAAAGSGLLAAKVAPAMQRAIEQSPRFIWDPERQVMTERVKEGVYRVMTNLVTR